MHCDEDMSMLRGGVILLPREFVLLSSSFFLRGGVVRGDDLYVGLLSFLSVVCNLAEQACSDQRGRWLLCALRALCSLHFEPLEPCT